MPASTAAPSLSTRAAPPLWNPAVAGNWSLILSPVFGALIQMRNWEALGEPALAQQSRYWAVGSAAFFATTTIVSAFLYARKGTNIDLAVRLMAVILIVVWYYASSRKQQVYIESRFGKAYPKKSWGRALLLGAGGLIAFIVIGGVFSYFIGAVLGRA